MKHFLPEIKTSTVWLIYIFAGALVLFFGTFQVAAQSDPQKFAAYKAQRLAQLKEEWPPGLLSLIERSKIIRTICKRSKRAQLYMGIGEDQKVIDDYSRIIALKLNDIDAYLTRAVFRVSLDRDDPALADYAQVIRLDARNYQAYTQRATVYFGRKMYDAALSDYTRILKFKPNDEYAYQSRSFTYFLNKQYKAAIADYTKMIKLDARSIYAFSGRAAAYKATRRPKTRGSRQASGG